jgi:hypothetical protein
MWHGRYTITRDAIEDELDLLREIRDALRILGFVALSDKIGDSIEKSLAIREEQDGRTGD